MLIGFRCKECNGVFDNMWGETCNGCREKERRHQELLNAKAIGAAPRSDEGARSTAESAVLVSEHSPKEEELIFLLREGEQFMQHKGGCASKRVLDYLPNGGVPAPCTCGLSQYMEKLKSRTK